MLGYSMYVEETAEDTVADLETWLHGASLKMTREAGAQGIGMQTMPYKLSSVDSQHVSGPSYVLGST